ncbi:hypothetical protein AMAG_19494 [Allomyces macrogynus ATCC 38327]|uniref:Uncharacterized protein n=1 Tax=Allomyces macrogynus (strain ATCC 38327) TaxID=578462 RepID=A0A0L0SW04_ALLM3|nr:hypothetical protein AMAG_19494 [Allomyces macrogynus ATCC 38327]|eukprot:KNE66697.1 hypothetical protein AMAG_19494 [Allomyces macrogynus ATCC 38327]
MAVHAAGFRTGSKKKVEQDAFAKLLDVIGKQTQEVVSRDLLLAHLVLLVSFHEKLRDDDNEAKDFVLLCNGESRYFAFMTALGTGLRSTRRS